MRIQITDTDDTFELADELWAPLLALARQFGWRPIGTIMPVFKPGSIPPEVIAYDQHWRGDYAPPQGQQLRPDDASDLRGHLGLALRDIEKLISTTPPAPGHAGRFFQLDKTDARRFFVMEPGPSRLRDWIDFCGECVSGLTLVPG